MKNFIDRVIRLDAVGYYKAPQDREVSPFKIPERTDIIELITGGEVFFETDGELKRFGRGTIFWHSAGEETIHITTSEKPYRCGTFGFSVKDNNRPVSRVSFWNTKYDLNMFVSQCLELFHEQKIEKSILAHYIYSTLLYHAATCIADTEEKYPAPLRRAIQFIENNLDKKISISQLADKSRISQPQLFKLFQKYLNTTPHNYILSQQLAKARTMLAGSTTPIKAIAAECGFNNIEVFYRCFQKESSMTPGKYRNQNIFNI